MAIRLADGDDSNGGDDLFDPLVTQEVTFNFGEQADENSANQPDPNYLIDGEYRLVVPEGIFMVPAAEEGGTPTYLPAGEVTYTYHNEVYSDIKITISPAPNSNVEDLKNIYVYFPNTKNSNTLNYSGNGKGTLIGPDGTAYKGGTYPTINYGDLNFQWKYTNSANQWIDGTYTFSVPANILTADGVYYDQPITAAYTIGESTSVKVIYGLDAAESYTVVDLAGVVVAKGGNEVLSNLTPGYYVINGKKVLVK